MIQRKVRYNSVLLGLFLSLVLVFSSLGLTRVNATQEIAQSVQLPRPWVRDQAKIWSPAERDRLEAILNDLNKKNTTEFVIVSESKLYDMRQLCSRAEALKNELRIGRPEFDNGILAFISKTGDSVSGCLSRGRGIPRVYYQYALFGKSTLDSIDRQIPELAKTVYSSKPIFRPAYRWLGVIGLVIILVIASFDFFKKDYLKGSILVISNSQSLAARKIWLFELGVGLICISMNTFILSQMSVGEGLHSWRHDFFLSLLVGLPSFFCQVIAINVYERVFCFLAFKSTGRLINSSSPSRAVRLYKELRNWSIGNSLIYGSLMMSLIARRLSFSDLYDGHNGTSYVFEASLFALPIMSFLSFCPWGGSSNDSAG